MRFIKHWILFIALFYSAMAAAVDKNPTDLGTAEADARFWDLLAELRCVVCQNQSLADSNASLAQDLRDEVKELFVSGKSDEEIKAFLVKRYGDFVLYRPAMEEKTYPLWIGPYVLLILALLALMYFLRRHGQETRTSGSRLSEDEQKRLDALLADDDKK